MNLVRTAITTADNLDRDRGNEVIPMNPISVVGYLSQVAAGADPSEAIAAGLEAGLRVVWHNARRLLARDGLTSTLDLLDLDDIAGLIGRPEWATQARKAARSNFTDATGATIPLNRNGEPTAGFTVDTWGDVPPAIRHHCLTHHGDGSYTHARLGITFQVRSHATEEEKP